MTLSWMLFWIVAGAALTVAAAAAERLAYLAGKPRRFVWFAAMLVTICWPAIVFGRAAIFSLRDSSGAVSAFAGVRLSTLVVATTGWDVGPRWDAMIMVAWAVLSALLLARLAFAIRGLRRRRNLWRPMELDGTRVDIASDAGPAVIGLSPMLIVLPEWVLGFDPPLRELVIRHESEHRMARDPYLLLCATLLTALFPWNLPLWIQSRRLRTAIELDCDARVLRSNVPWREYARLLLTIAERRLPSTQALAPALSERTSNLERRIATMSITPRLSPVSAAYLGAVTIVAVALACAVDKPQSPDAHSVSGAAAPQKSPVGSPQMANAPQAGYFEFQVEKLATLISAPRIGYPAAMRGSGIKGEVLTQFVVDETGRVDMQSLKVLKSTNPAFTAAVKATLPMAQFAPAEVGGRKVKQLVQQAYEFPESQ